MSQPFTHTASVEKSSFKRRLAKAAAVAVALLWLLMLGDDLRAQSIQASCDSCGRAVSSSSRKGENCPHCGAYWAEERWSISSGSASRGGASTKSSSRAKVPANSKEIMQQRAQQKTRERQQRMAQRQAYLEAQRRAHMMWVHEMRTPSIIYPGRR